MPPTIVFDPFTDCQNCGAEDDTMIVRVKGENAIALCLKCWQTIAQDIADNADMAED